jgi:hypothetical protein
VLAALVFSVALHAALLPVPMMPVPMMPARAPEDETEPAALPDLEPTHAADRSAAVTGLAIPQQLQIPVAAERPTGSFEAAQQANAQAAYLARLQIRLASAGRCRCVPLAANTRHA